MAAALLGRAVPTAGLITSWALECIDDASLLGVAGSDLEQVECWLCLHCISSSLQSAVPPQNHRDVRVQSVHRHAAGALRCDNFALPCSARIR